MKDQTRANLRALNQYIATFGKKYERFNYALWKGQGYFYFYTLDEAPADTPEPPPSIYCCHLHHATLEQWKGFIQSSIEQWVEENV